MKSIIIATLCVLLLSSCSAINIGNRGVRYFYGQSAINNAPVNRRAVASTSIRSYVDSKTGAVVNASTYIKYCFSVQFGTLKVINGRQGLEVYQYHNNIWQRIPTLYRQDILVWTKQRPQLVYINGPYVYVYAAKRSNMTWRRAQQLAVYKF